jgi:hypothetical protein
MLQPIVKDWALYLKNSTALKEELKCMELPPNARLLTDNTVAIYPSIHGLLHLVPLGISLLPGNLQQVWALLQDTPRSTHPPDA